MFIANALSELWCFGVDSVVQQWVDLARLRRNNDGDSDHSDQNDASIILGSVFIWGAPTGPVAGWGAD
jgi:hypothetical protein